ncbi:hypothetical protein LNY53_29575 [Klebsiella pneumoniae]|nr:hypothetical protein [Klebsiella pneumoniae]
MNIYQVFSSGAGGILAWVTADIAALGLDLLLRQCGAVQSAITLYGYPHGAHFFPQASGSNICISTAVLMAAAYH